MTYIIAFPMQASGATATDPGGQACLRTSDIAVVLRVGDACAAPRLLEDPRDLFRQVASAQLERKKNK